MRDFADLKIDLDSKSKKVLRTLKFRYKWLSEYYPQLKPATVKVYRTHKGWHVYVALHTVKYSFTARDRAFMQLALGSDWLREIRNMKRIGDGFKDWNILFSSKTKNGRVKSFERYYSTYLVR